MGLACPADPLQQELEWPGRVSSPRRVGTQVTLRAHPLAYEASLNQTLTCDPD